MSNGLAELNAITDRVLAYRPPPGRKNTTKPAKRQRSTLNPKRGSKKSLRGTTRGNERVSTSLGECKKKRVVRNGLPTNELVFSAFLKGNSNAFPEILRLYVRPGSIVADVTYGQGVFWRNVPSRMYEVRATDIRKGVDCRKLPYKNGEIDCVVFDPPYMHTPGGTAHVSHKPFEKHYRNNGSGNQTESKYHEAVLALYRDGGLEAYRVLREKGVLIVKCQDEVCSNRQKFTHVEIMQMYEKIGYIAEDLFVIIRNNHPGVSRMVHQVHARKTHSYFLVFWKRGSGHGLWGSA